MTEEFQRIIQQDREARKKTSWKGTLLQYLELVQDNPDIGKLSHKRLYDMIVSCGVRDISADEDPKLKRLYKSGSVRTYNFFSEDFYGLEKTINQIVRYFHSASLKGEESRQVLYLVGPVGSGKSSLVERLKKGLEELSFFYAIDGCPMFEYPLHLIPRHLIK